MNDFKYHYLFTSFDLETFEMEDFRYNFVNITAFRLVDTNDVFVKEMLKEMEQFSKHKNMKFKKNLAVEVKLLTILSCLWISIFLFVRIGKNKFSFLKPSSLNQKFICVYYFLIYENISTMI